MELTGYVAYCLDEALLVLDYQVEERLRKVESGQKDAEKAARARRDWLTKYFGGPEAVIEQKGRFRDPADMF